MKRWLDVRLGEVLAEWVQSVDRNARRAVLAIVALTVGLAAYAALYLGVDSDVTHMLSPDLPSQRRLLAFGELFPQLNNTLLVVVDGETPELAREASDALAARLALQKEQFQDVYVPGQDPFFERNALLYRSVSELEDFADRMARFQPLIAELERDNSIGNLCSLIQLSLKRVHEAGEDEARWTEILGRVGEATVEVYDEFPISVSWEEMLLRGSALDPITRWVIVAEPVLDFGSLLPAGRAIRAIREAAAELGYSPERGVRVRVTGNPALNHEEMIELARDIGVSGVFCFLLVAGVLYRALRSIHLVVAAVITLLTGLIWTSAFAAAAVGHLNLVSICFSILFIGLGVDFAIHLGMEYESLRSRGLAHAEAVGAAAKGVGASLVICAITTAIGFYVFIPTDFRGVGELGLISGTGMLVALFLTLTLFTALISSWLRFDPLSDGIDESPTPTAAFDWLEGHARFVRIGAVVFGLGALSTLPWTRFNPNVVQIRNPMTESVQTFDDLLADNERTSPWLANLVVPNLEVAQAVSAELRQLDAVGTVVNLADYVPADQEEKREILSEVALMLDNPDAGQNRRSPPSVDEQIDALRALRDFLAGAPGTPSSPLGGSMEKLRERLDRFLERLETNEDPASALERLDEILLGRLPERLAALRRALDPESITLENLPQELVARMQSADGQARVQIFPREDLRGELALERFVDEVLTANPNATGMAVNLVDFGRATVSSLRQALVLAVVCIALLLWLLSERITDVILVLVPVLLAAALTAASMVAIGLSFNFANVVAIPLMLGMGVDSGIHLVHRAHSEELGEAALMASTTARAVFYSAITTVVSFGSLSLSGHRGVASLGVVLVIGMFFTLVANLVVLPALITGLGPTFRRQPEGSSAR